jgi:type II secretory pathway component PulK
MPVRPIVIEREGARFAVTFRDARGVLSVNSASEEEIARLLRAHDIDPPLNQRIAQELADYRDEDDFVRERGAERPDYTRRGLTPRNAPLETIDELRYLPSMTPEIFERIRGDLCIGGDGRIHVQSAPPEVLRAVEGVTPAGVERLLSRRAEEAPMTREDLEDALSPASLAAIDRFRLTPSTRLIAVVRRLDAAGAPVGPAVEVELALLRTRGVAFLSTRHTTTEPAS